MAQNSGLRKRSRNRQPSRLIHCENAGDHTGNAAEEALDAHDTLRSASSTEGDPDETEEDEEMQQELGEAQLARQRENKLLQTPKKRPAPMPWWTPRKEVRTWWPAFEMFDEAEEEKAEDSASPSHRCRAQYEIKNGWAPRKKYRFTPRQEDDELQGDHEKERLPIARLFRPETGPPQMGWFSTQRIGFVGHAVPQARVATPARSAQATTHDGCERWRAQRYDEPSSQRSWSRLQRLQQSLDLAGWAQQLFEQARAVPLHTTILSRNQA